jgi:hypothetical protein
LSVATTVFRASAPRAARARSRFDTSTAGYFAARDWPQVSQVSDYAKLQ